MPWIPELFSERALARHGKTTGAGAWKSFRFAGDMNSWLADRHATVEDVTPIGVRGPIRGPN